MPLHRRSLLAGALTLGAAQAFPGLSRAQARKLVFATFTGSWEEAHRGVLVPAFRNLVEYQSDLLYARGKTTVRALVLALIGMVKAGLLVMLLASADDQGTGWIVGLNGLFLVLWLVSAAATYTAFDGRRRPGSAERPVRPVPQPVE